MIFRGDDNIFSLDIGYLFIKKEDFEKQEGIAFFIIYYSARNELYYMRFEEIKKFWERMENGGRKSVRFEELDPKFFMKLKGGVYVPYLEMLKKDLELREA